MLLFVGVSPAETRSWQPSHPHFWDRPRNVAVDGRDPLPNLRAPRTGGRGIESEQFKFKRRVDATQSTGVGGQRGPASGAGNVGDVSGAGVEDIGLEEQLVDMPGRRSVELAAHRADTRPRTSAANAEGRGPCRRSRRSGGRDGVPTTDLLITRPFSTERGVSAAVVLDRGAAIRASIARPRSSSLASVSVNGGSPSESNSRCSTTAHPTSRVCPTAAAARRGQRAGQTVGGGTRAR